MLTARPLTLREHSAEQPLTKPIKPTRDDHLDDCHPDATERLTWSTAMQTFNVVHMSRIDSYQKYWRSRGGNFSEWVRIYPELRRAQRQLAKSQTWILDRNAEKIHWRPMESGEEGELSRFGVPQVTVSEYSDVYWYFFDYDQGIKRKMTGDAAFQIECGYQWIKMNNYNVDAALRAGVWATMGSYAMLREQHNVEYKISYRTEKAVQENKTHIAVHQNNVLTGFPRLLERFPPESTPARVPTHAFMNVFVTNVDRTDASISVDLFVQGGTLYLHGDWSAHHLRFVFDSPIPRNREKAFEALNDLINTNKLIGLGKGCSVQLRPDARSIASFLVKNSVDEEGADVVSQPCSNKSRLEMMAHYDTLRRMADVSNEQAAFSTKEFYGDVFSREFSTVDNFIKIFNRSVNGSMVKGCDWVPHDLVETIIRAMKLHDRREMTNGEASSYCLNYIFDLIEGRAHVSFASVDCSSTGRERAPSFFSNFADHERERDTRYSQKVEMRKTELFLKNNPPSVRWEDAVLDVNLDLTKDKSERMIMTSFPFDEKHIYLFRNGFVCRLTREETVPFLKEIAHIQVAKARQINGHEILSVETYQNGDVKYGCRRIGDQSKTIERKTYEEIQYGFGEEKSPSSESSFDDNKMTEEGRPDYMLPSATQENVTRGEDAPIDPAIEKRAEILSTFLGDFKKRDRRTDSMWTEFISHLVDSPKINKFPVIAGFSDPVSLRENGMKRLYFADDFGIDMNIVISVLMECYEKNKVCGIVVDKEQNLHMYEILASTFNVNSFQIEEELERLGLESNVIIQLAGRELSMTSRSFIGTNRNFRWNIDRDPDVGEQMIVALGQCKLVEGNTFDEESLSSIDQHLGQLHLWKDRRMRLGRPCRFAVFFTHSKEFDFLDDRVKRRVSNEPNPNYDEHMDFLKEFSIEKWKMFVNGSAEEDNSDGVYVMVIDHAIYTFRRVSHCFGDDEDELERRILKAYYGGRQVPHTSFLYRDNVRMNAREECTRRGFYTKLVVRPNAHFQCPICYETKSSLSQLSCGHSACHQCIRLQMYAGNNSCAICRHDIMHPFMIPRPSRVDKELIHEEYGLLFLRPLKYQCFEDNLEWNKVYVDGQRGH